MDMKEKTKMKRLAILKAAMVVFMEKGYEKAKIIDIAQQAGIGKGTVYEYFESKEQLFRCLLDAHCQRYLKQIEETLEKLTEASCREKLLALLQLEAKQAEVLASSSRTPLQVQLELFQLPEFERAFRRILSFKYDSFRRIIQDGVDRGELRQINVSLAALMVMGTQFFISGSTTVHRKQLYQEEPVIRLTSQELEKFTDESMLDLILNGFAVPA